MSCPKAVIQFVTIPILLLLALVSTYRIWWRGFSLHEPSGYAKHYGPDLVPGSQPLVSVNCASQKSLAEVTRFILFHGFWRILGTCFELYQWTLRLLDFGTGVLISIQAWLSSNSNRIVHGGCHNAG